MARLVSLWVAIFLQGSLGAAAYPDPPPWQPDPSQREHLRRSLTLLATSTPQHRHTARVLFYGQSITQQDWWKEVARYLRDTYTNANLVIENRAIGGHASQLLVKTAEADLYPFQPDLLIFHLYGSHIEYENIIRRVRERTCADILLQTDHITKDEALTEEIDPAKLTPKQWDPWMNYTFLPETAAKYGACRADIHEQWKLYLREHQLKAADLLKDGVHLNAHGEWFMAELLKRYLAPLPPRPGYDPLNDERVRTTALAPPKAAANLELEFTGTRLDLVFAESARSPIKVLIDGRKPSSMRELYGFTRVSAFPASDWPLLLRVTASKPLVAENWSMKLQQFSPDGKVCRFSVTGSVTGPDGEGLSTNRFVSPSGRVVLEPDDWNVAYCVSVFQRPLPADHVVRWAVVLRGADNPAPPNPEPGTERVLTIASGLPPGKHKVTIEAPGDAVQAIRSYQPR